MVLDDVRDQHGTPPVALHGSVVLGAGLEGGSALRPSAGAEQASLGGASSLGSAGGPVPLLLLEPGSSAFLRVEVSASPWHEGGGEARVNTQLQV